MTLDLDRITHPLHLARGSHQRGSGKGCAMNVISYINGDVEITDFPECSARPLSRLVQALNDRLAGPDGFLSPEDSVTVIDLGWKTVGTADTPRTVVWWWLADLLVDPEMGVVQYATPRGAGAIQRVAGLCARKSVGDVVPRAEWDEARADAYAAADADADAAAAAYAAAAAAADAYADAAADAAAAAAADAYADAVAAADADAVAAASAVAVAAAYAYAAAAADADADAYAAAAASAVAAADAYAAAAADAAADADAAAAAYAAADAAADADADADAAAAAAADAAADARITFTRWAIQRWRDLAGLDTPDIDADAVNAALADIAK